MTATTLPATATAAGWPAPGLAWQLRTATSRSHDLPELLERAARHLDATGAQVHDAVELDAFVLDLDRPIAHATVLDRLGEVHTAHPDRAAKQVVMVRMPSLREALAGPEDQSTPLAQPSSALEQCRFPMTILSAPPHPYPLDLEL